MNSLKQFQGVIRVADRPLSQRCQAFYMDGGSGVREKEDMRADVGLGSCQCCDYFLIHNDHVLLIEETRLLQRKRNLEREYAYLSDNDRQKFVETQLFQRNHLKVYGAMLVLCRLAAKYCDVKDEIKGKKHHFWLVVSEITPEDMLFFESFSDKLLLRLQSVLTHELLEDVQVLPAYKLEEKLKNAPTS